MLRIIMLTKAQKLGIACLGYWSGPPELNMSAFVWIDNAMHWIGPKWFLNLESVYKIRKHLHFIRVQIHLNPE